MKKVLSIVLATLLAMSLFGTVNASAAAADSDTVLVLDYSGSMAGEPIVALKQAASIFCEGVVSAKGTHRVAIVIYSDSFVFQGFSSDYSVLAGFINRTDAYGSTDISAPLKKAHELIRSSSAGTKNVLLMTDGLPNVGENTEDGPYTEEEYYFYSYANAAYNAAAQLRQDCNLYTLGFFHGFKPMEFEEFLEMIAGEGWEDYSEEDIAYLREYYEEYKQDRENQLRFGRKFLNDLQSDGYWEVLDPEDLTVTFENILSDMQEVTQEWWETLPAWLQWILRYLAFGWIWMRK